MEIEYLGNRELLKLPKTAFLAASVIPPDMVLNCYDWALKMAKEEQCVISGLYSIYDQFSMKLYHILDKII